MLRQAPRRLGNAARDFQGGIVDMLTGDAPIFSRSGNAALRPTLRTMRARSRLLAENNDYMREFLRILLKKVLGPRGIRLAVRAMRPDGKTIDQQDSDYLETSFEQWAQKGVCTVCGRYSWKRVQQLVLRSLARDGEVLVRLVRNFPNRWGFALQLIETDLLDETLNSARGSGAAWGIQKASPDNEIRMGIERDPFGRVVAYHLLTRHPGDDLGIWAPYAKYDRVAARDMLHIFLPDRLDDARGAPWAWTAIRRLLMLGGYEEAELVAARLGASKGGFFTKEAETTSELTGDDEDGTGNIIQDVQPGQFEQLPVGWKFEKYDPQHPNGAFANFMKSMLRGASAGFGINYNSLAKDGEGINFSTIRHFELDDRDFYRDVQDLLKEELCGPIFTAWLDMGLLKPGALNLPPSKFDKFNAATWHARGWEWIDPQKDITADAQAVNMGVKSRTQVCAERGVEFEDVLRDLKREKELADQYGVPLGTGDPRLELPVPGGEGDAAESDAGNKQI